MPIFEQQKLIFIHIPRTAGTSILVKYTLPHFDNQKYNNISDFDPKILRETSKEILSKSFKFTHFNFKSYHKYIKNNEYKIFTIVRNPYDRIFSYYKFHIYKLKINSEISLLNNEFEKFNQYLNLYLKDEKFLLKRSQTYFLLNENKIIDSNIKIIKYENLNEEIKDLPKLNASINFVSKKDVYNQENIKIVKEFFLEDFINFNYPTEIEL